MAFSKLEKALALAVGLDIAVPGTSRKAAMAAANALVRGGRAIVPPATRIATATPAGRAVVGAGLLGGAYQAGVFDPVEDAINREVERRVGGIQQTLANVEMATNLMQTPRGQESIVKTTKRKASKFNKAIGAAMKAVKKSKSNGKPGTMRKPKDTFKRIIKVWKAKSAGRKVSNKGETGIISRNIKRYIG